MKNRTSKQNEEVHLYDYGKGRKWKPFPLRFALGFPNKYSVGMANLGFLWIYHLLNRMNSVRCDRFFQDTPAPEGAIKTIEAERPLKDYSVVGFSMPFEMDFINLPLMLERGGIEPLASLREFPLVVVGGIAVSANPEPITDFVDAVFVGESEEIIGDFVKLYLKYRASRKNFRSLEIKRLLLEKFVSVPGIYVPSFYEISYLSDGRIGKIQPGKWAIRIVKRQRLSIFRGVPHSPIVAKKSAFQNMFLVEMSRGCPFRCGFCLSRCLSQPFRAFEESDLRKVIVSGLSKVKKIGIIGTGFSSAGTLSSVCRAVLEGRGEISFSSLRLTPQVMRVFSEFGDNLRLRTVSVAPETASAHLRQVICKDVYEDSPEAVGILEKIDVRKVKLYFLVGIPGEGEEDIVEIVRYAHQVWKRKWGIELSVSPLVPKPFTPFQWHPMENLESIKNKLSILKDGVRGAGFGIKAESPRIAEIQAIISRGDRRLGAAISQTAEYGGGPAGFLRAMKKHGLSKEFYLYRTRAKNEIFPWDTLEYPETKQTLWKEYERIKRLAG